VSTLCLFDERLEPACQFTLPEEPPKFHGETYVPEWDEERLTGQWRRVWDVLKDGRRRTLDEIREEIIGRFGKKDSHTGISARIRQLRDMGAPIPTCERRPGVAEERGCFEYWAEVKR
jgi:hypothetical protein